MEKDHNSYFNIIKSISILGGVKIIQIIVSIIKNKVIALILGPVGIGISGMLTSTTSLISAITGFGLHTSSINNFSQAWSNKDEVQIRKVAKIITILTLFTGIIGTFVVIILSRQLSIWTFGNETYTTAYLVISSIILFDQLSVGKFVILQGSHNYKYIAKLSIIISILGLITSIPLIYYFRLNSIAPIILLSSIINWVITSFYSNKLKIKTAEINYIEFISESKKMLLLGSVIAISGIVNTFQILIFRIYLSHYGSIKDVGLYTAGSAIVTTYIGIILTSMGTDYSPRLAAARSNIKLLIDLINKQIEIVLLIITPLIILFIAFIKEFTILLYSSQFIDIISMLKWMVIGMYFRGISWCLSFAQVARNEPKFFFLNELLSNIYALGLSILFYYKYGLTGIGIAFFITYLLYSIQMFFLCNFRFNFKLKHRVFKIIYVQCSLCTLFFIINSFTNYSPLKYIIGIAEFILLSAVSFILLKKSINSSKI